MTLARHTAYNIAGSSLPILVSLLTVPLYLRVIGVERYGLLAICWTLLGLVGFVSLGMGPAITRNLALLRDAAPKQRSELFWTGATINAGLALLGGLIVLVGAGHYFATVEIHQPGVRDEIGPAIPWLAAAMVFNLVSGVFTGALQGRQWFGAFNLVGTATTTAVAVIPLICAIVFGANLQILLMATLAVSILSAATLFLLCVRAVPLGAPTPPQMEQFRTLFAYGGWMTVTSLAAPLVMLSDRLVIGSILGTIAVSAYVIPYNLVSRVGLFPGSLANAALPRLAADPATEEARLQGAGLKALTAILTLLCVAGAAIMGPFLHVWIEDQLARIAAPIGCVLIIGFWFQGIGHIPSTIIQGRGRPDIITKLILAYVIPYFAVLMLFLHWFGVVGAAMAWSLRAMFDFTLFWWAPIRRDQVEQLAFGVALIGSAVATALLMPWKSVPYVVIMTVLVGIAAIFAMRLVPKFRFSRAGS